MNKPLPVAIRYKEKSWYLTETREIKENAGEMLIFVYRPKEDVKLPTV